MKAIEIVPADSGWMVRSEALDNELYFRTGGSAESAAIRLAQGWVDAGEEAHISIFLRDGSLARRFAVPVLREGESATGQERRGATLLAWPPPESAAERR